MSCFFFNPLADGRVSFAPSLPPSPSAEEELKLLWRAGLLRENHPSKEPSARPSFLLTRNRSSQDVCSSWIISTGAPSSVMVVRVSGMSSLSW